MPTHKSPLEVSVKNGAIIISIGAETLAGAFEESEYGKPFDIDSNNWKAKFKVTDPEEFAQEVARALQVEEEDGTTMVHTLLDQACINAVEDGALGVEEVA
jgi:hypothetical protein